MERKNHTLFYFNKDVDEALRKCDEARATKLKAIPDDGYADGGEPYTDEELDIINNQ